MRQSTYIHASRTTDVITRWRGLGALLAVAFYSLFFAAHLHLQDTPIYVQNGILFGAQTQSVFQDLTAARLDDHRGIGPAFPAFTFLHHGPAQTLIRGWSRLGQDFNQARKHGVALLTCLAGALCVVMVYHALLWSGIVSLRAMLLSAACGAGTCISISSALPDVWVFAGLGVALMAAMTARGPLAPWWLHALATAYAIGVFAGNIIPAFLFCLARCAYDSSQQQRFVARPLLITLLALAMAFGLAKLQRIVYPKSAPLPTEFASWKLQDAPPKSNSLNAGLVAREVFVSNIVAPRSVATESKNPSSHRLRIVLANAAWSQLNLQNGVSAAWLLLLALSFAGLVWRAQMDPYTLAILSVIVWAIAALPYYGVTDQLLVQACLWTPGVVIAVGLGLERSLEHWPRLKLPVTVLLIAFISAQITRNWMFIQEITSQIKL